MMLVLIRAFKDILCWTLNTKVEGECRSGTTIVCIETIRDCFDSSHWEQNSWHFGNLILSVIHWIQQFKDAIAKPAYNKQHTRKR